jgi:hypothetical protein
VHDVATALRRTGFLLAALVVSGRHGVAAAELPPVAADRAAPVPAPPPAPMQPPPARPYPRPLIGAEYHSIALVSASVAARLGCDSGWFVQASPGWYAGRLSLGYGVAGMPGICGVYEDPEIILPLLGWQAKVSLMQTWGSHEHRAEPATYLGPELVLDCLVHGSIGVFGKISSQDVASDDWRVAWALGVGF